MYVPSAFERTDIAELFAFIESYSFATLVSTHEGEPFATHLPLLLERDTGPHGTLVGHMARANPHWRNLNGQPVLVIFSGPHAYVSPSWYESENVVPTWNYVAVHATGRFQLLDDSTTTAAIVASMVAKYEQKMSKPWQLDTTTDYFRNMVRAIVGFRIEVTRLEGKWKLSQNHSPERREKVAAALERSSNPDAQEVARLMRENRS
jgi:transcriptional regulator